MAEDCEIELPRVLDYNLGDFLREESAALDRVIKRVVDELNCEGEFYSAHSSTPRDM